MSDELRRGFQDKMHGRGGAPRRAGHGAPDAASGTRPAECLRVGGLDHGAFPAAASLNPRFLPLVPRLRLTLEMGPALTGPLRWLGDPERALLLDLCPGLPEHECGPGPESIRQLLLEGRGEAGSQEQSKTEQDDGLAAAHLIEHVALELLAATSGVLCASGAACAYGGETHRCDIFLECADVVLGRAVALLAAAAVRDLRGGAERSLVHRHCRDLLTFFTRFGRKAAAPEDVAAALNWERSDAREALEALTRLGFVQRLAAPLTFSSPSGVIFRRTVS